MAVLSIFFGYLTLSFIFYFYGGLGMTYRKNTSDLIEPVFGKKGTKYFLSGLLAIGQIGWFAIINQIGGESLAALLQVPAFVGISIYSTAMILMALLNVHRLGVTKFITAVASLGLIACLFVLKMNTFQVADLFSVPTVSENITWGIAIVIASFISFASVSPDFTSQLETETDLRLTVFFGVFLPGLVISTVGALLFLHIPVVSLAGLIGVSSLALFGHFFNIVTNSDAAISVYTIALRFQYMFKLSFRWGVVVATLIGALLSIFNINSSLVTWLTILAGIYPAIIGVTMANYSLAFFHRNLHEKKKNLNWWAVLIVLFAFSLIFVVKISQLQWIVGLISFLLYLLFASADIHLNKLQEEAQDDDAS